MYILPLLLLFITPAAAEPSIGQLCREVMIEVEEAIERGDINKHEAHDILQGCQRLK
jgi:hypothetical protein